MIRIRHDLRRWSRTVRPGSEIGRRLLRLFDRLLCRVRAEFEDHPGIAGRQQVDLGLGEIARLQASDDHPVETFDGDRTKALVVRHRVSGEVDVVESENQQNPVRVASDEIDASLENERARALGADERARQIEAVLRKKLIQVEAGHAPLDRRKALPDQVGIAIPQIP